MRAVRPGGARRLRRDGTHGATLSGVRPGCCLAGPACGPAAEGAGWHCDHGCLGNHDVLCIGAFARLGRKRDGDDLVAKLESAVGARPEFVDHCRARRDDDRHLGEEDGVDPAAVADHQRAVLLEETHQRFTLRLQDLPPYERIEWTCPKIATRPLPWPAGAPASDDVKRTMAVYTASVGRRLREEGLG